MYENYYIDVELPNFYVFFFFFRVIFYGILHEREII